MCKQTIAAVGSIFALIAILTATTTDAREIVRISAAGLSPKPPIEPRIIGGEQTTVQMAPYQVSIQNTFGEHVCGGSIINKDTILTAAHCMEWPKEYLKIVVGTANWTQPGATHYVDKVKIHCLHNKPMYQNDIALIRLTKSIKFTKSIQAVKLATQNTLNDGDKLILTGWGSTKLWGKSPDMLHKVELEYVNHTKCKSLVRNSAWLGDDHICSSTKNGKGSCHGDSGGPLVDANQVQVGVVNWGEPCAQGSPDAYASVAYFHDWIRTNLNSQAANSTC